MLSATKELLELTKERWKTVSPEINYEEVWGTLNRYIRKTVKEDRTTLVMSNICQISMIRKWRDATDTRVVDNHDKNSVVSVSARSVHSIHRSLGSVSQEDLESVMEEEGCGHSDSGAIGRARSRKDRQLLSFFKPNKLKMSYEVPSFVFLDRYLNEHGISACSLPSSIDANKVGGVKMENKKTEIMNPSKVAQNFSTLINREDLNTGIQRIFNTLGDSISKNNFKSINMEIGSITSAGHRRIRFVPDKSFRPRSDINAFKCNGRIREDPFSETQDMNPLDKFQGESLSKIETRPLIGRSKSMTSMLRHTEEKEEEKMKTDLSEDVDKNDLSLVVDTVTHAGRVKQSLAMNTKNDVSSTVLDSMNYESASDSDSATSNHCLSRRHISSPKKVYVSAYEEAFDRQLMSLERRAQEAVKERSEYEYYINEGKQKEKVEKVDRLKRYRNNQSKLIEQIGTKDKMKQLNRNRMTSSSPLIGIASLGYSNDSDVIHNKDDVFRNRELLRNELENQIKTKMVLREMISESEKVSERKFIDGDHGKLKEEKLSAIKAKEEERRILMESWEMNTKIKKLQKSIEEHGKLPN